MNEHLAEVLDQLRGVNEDLDEIADRIEALNARSYTLDERQTVIARIFGNADDDLVTALALLTQALCIVPADQPMDEHDRKQAEQHGQDAALWLTDWHLRGPASSAAALIDPANDTAGGRCTPMTDEQRKELSKKVADANKKSQNRPR
jgi:hypothetical protein